LFWPRLKQILETAKVEFIVAAKKGRSFGCDEFFWEETITSR
jgi:hypothetical protein